MEDVINKYQEYVKQFDQSDERISYKFSHSLRVMNKMDSLSTYLKQTEEDKKLAIIIGLFHDYGRFYQVENFKTYQDVIFDHGNYGAEELITHHHLKDFIEETLDERVIYNAIINHNKYQIMDGLDEKSILFSKMIRDTDKLDILEGIVKGVVSIENTDHIVNEEVRKEFYKHQSIHTENIKDGNDKIIQFLGYLYDIHFLWTFSYIKEHQIIEHIYQKLQYPKNLQEYFEYSKQYIEEKLKENSYVREEI